MRNNLIGNVPGSDILGTVIDLLQKVRSGAVPEEHLKLLGQGKLIPAPGVKLASSRDPLGMLFSKTERLLSRKLGRHIVPFTLPSIVTVENLENWARFNMRPVFLPELDLTEDARLPKKYIRPGSWYYLRLREGKIGETFAGLAPTKIQPGWFLADFSVGVDYTDGTQVFPNDPWASLITRLRAEKQVGGYDDTPVGSRFAISHDEWLKVVLVYMASKLGFPAAKLRFERASEFNLIGNVYDTARGQFNMWTWLADPFEDSGRLFGGNRDDGGLASVGYDWLGRRHDYVAGRPLVSLD